MTDLQTVDGQDLFLTFFNFYLSNLRLSVFLIINLNYFLPLFHTKVGNPACLSDSQPGVKGIL